MKLYIYDHCPFCTKARMIFGLKGLEVTVVPLAEDDIETPTRMVGKKALPILQKADGSHMPESMDIVHHVDALSGAALVVGGGDAAIKAWSDAAWGMLLPLTIPRIAQADLPEFATPSARAAFVARQTARMGNLDDHLARSPELVAEAEAQLATLAPLLEGREAVDADDFLLFPQLRMLSTVKELAWPPAVEAYVNRLASISGVALHSPIQS